MSKVTMSDIKMHDNVLSFYISLFGSSFAPAAFFVVRKRNGNNFGNKTSEGKKQS